MKQYEDFFELIVLGHNAHLDPEEIHRRFKAAGLAAPPVGIIRRIGRKLLGNECRWRPDRPRSWSVDRPNDTPMRPEAKKIK